MYAHMVCNGTPGDVGLSTLNAGVRIASHILDKVYVSNIQEVQTNLLPVWSLSQQV